MDPAMQAIMAKLDEISQKLDACMQAMGSQDEGPGDQPTKNTPPTMQAFKPGK